jgi:prepilin-type N-terminal cleavage/methylation domain-containing protein
MLRITRRTKAFSLVELVIVIVIIGVIAAIAIPRLSRGATGADESGLRGDLAVLRNAIELYASEHSGAYPGATIVNQLTMYTDGSGVTNATKTTQFKFGPYIRKPFPSLKVGDNAGSNTVLVVASGAPAVNEAGGEGWVYSSATGDIIGNSDELAEDGVTTFDEF